MTTASATPLGAPPALPDSSRPDSSRDAASSSDTSSVAADVPDAPDPATDPTATPLGFGVGARVTAALMADDYAAQLTGILSALDDSGLVRETGDVSTYLGGHEATLQRYLVELAAALARTEHHATLSVLFSRGCPGEVVCELPGGAGPRGVEVPSPQVTGRFATAEWALYPLADQVSAEGTSPDHMRDIYAAIDHARSCGIEVSTEHYATRLAGDLGLILETVVAAWVLTGQSIQHVTTHLTISVNSPSHPGVQA